MKSRVRFNQSGETHLAVIVSVVMSFLFVAMLIFGIWAFSGKQDYKNNTDKKISTAVDAAVKKEDASKDVQFAEALKSPVKHYTGSSTFGSINFDYPKSYSAYVLESSDSSDTPVNGYFQPDVVPGTDAKTSFALRFQIINGSYSSVVRQYDDKITTGKIRFTAFRAAKVPGTLGVRLDGEVTSGKQGSMILLPVRDKTLQLWTESVNFKADFDTFTVPSISFVP